ncbi:hypothetical protein ACL02R_24040 [Streptomyces sp. MS19]|uniref:hypothetical protein n=1 Tax=Streptomyces sp. MS19 TaxID=3385972 RepID=UPI00399FA930
MTRPPAEPGHHRAVAFHVPPDREERARRIVSAQLRYWRVPEVVEAAEEGMGLLLAAMRRHADAAPRCRVQLVLLWDRLALSVCDHPPDVCGRTGGGPAGQDGVAGVRDSGGVRTFQDESGRTLWLTVPVPVPEGPAEARGLRLPWSAHA